MPKKKTKTSKEMSKKKSSVKKTSGGKKILIIEDERPLAHALELKLGHEGYEIEVAYTGAEGLQKAKKGGYKLILLDLILPEMDGFTVLKQIGKNKKTKVIVLSNLGQDEDKQRTKDLGAVEYCVKSNTPLSEIVKRVKAYL